MYTHIGLDKSLFSDESYKQVLQEVESFLNEHLKKKEYFFVSTKVNSFYKLETRLYYL